MRHAGQDEQGAALIAGIAARRAGVPRDANPHEPRTWARTGWAEGWDLAAELHSGREDDESCRACGCHCWEEGGCGILRESGVMEATRIHIRTKDPKDAARTERLYDALNEKIRSSDPRALVQNRRDHLDAARDFWRAVCGGGE